MKILKIFCKVLELAFFISPFLLYSSAHNSNTELNIQIIFLILFLILFFSFAALGIFASKKNVDADGFSPDFKSVDTFETVILAIIWIIDIILLLSVRQKINSFFIPFGIILLTFTPITIITEKGELQIIESSPRYKVGLPWYFYAFPFVLFIAVPIKFSDDIPEDIMDNLALLWFAFCGALLVYAVWHSYYTIDVKNGTINKERVFSFLSAKDRAIVFENITEVTDKRFYYIVKDKGMQMKIYKHYTGAMKFRKALRQMNIPFEE